MKMQDEAVDLVSVVIPVFNAGKYLEETLASILAQSYPAIEVVAVDDGSKDDSVAILERFSGRLKLVKQQNSGAAAARNRGVREASGKWIAFLDADDIWDSAKLERQLAQCGALAWSYTDSVFMGGVNEGRLDSEFTPKRQGMVLEALVLSNFIGTSSVMIEREKFLQIGGFDESLRSIQDWDLWLRLAREYPIGYVDTPLVRYRVHNSSASRSTRKTLPNHIRVIEKAFVKDGPAANLTHLKPRALACSFSTCSHIAEEEGDWRFAVRCALDACRQVPSSGAYWKRAAKVLVKSALASTGLRR